MFLKPLSVCSAAVGLLALWQARPKKQQSAPPAPATEDPCETHPKQDNESCADNAPIVRTVSVPQTAAAKPAAALASSFSTPVPTKQSRPGASATPAAVSDPSKDIRTLKDLQQATQNPDAAKEAAESCEVVDLSACKLGPALGHFPPLLAQLHRLHTLNLSGGAITHLPCSLSSLSNLQVLNVSHNVISSLPHELGSLTLLTSLDAGHNHLKVLPDRISRLTALRILNVMGNQLTELPSGIGNLRSLRLLGLKSNQLVGLPDSICQLTSLVELFVTDNRLTSFPEEFSRLSSLVKLQASFNALEEVPASLMQLPKLELLRLAACNIKQLPTSMLNSGAWPKLAWASIAGNPVYPAPTARRDGLEAVSMADVQRMADKAQHLGAGASGDVVKGNWKGSPVAVKLFRGDVSPDGKVSEEMAIACLVDHPRVTRALAVADQALVMNLEKGVPLADRPTSAHLLRCRYADGRTFSTEAIIRMGMQLAEALAYLHSQGICHGDVYAHNLLVDEDHNAILCDFGAAFSYKSSLEPFWEAMEVRAYGLLLRDLVSRIQPIAGVSGLSPISGRLQLLVRQCAELLPSDRPPFTDVITKLQEIRDGLNEKTHKARGRYGS